MDLIDECNDRFLLTDADTLQIIENTGASREIAQTIEVMILNEISETIRIKDLQCWGQLPAIRVPWTDWLVYSVLRKWGDNVEVAASYPQFRYAVPLIAPKGKMDTIPYAEVIKTGVAPEQNATAMIHDLDHIDDLIADLIDIDEEWEKCDIQVSIDNDWKINIYTETHHTIRKIKNLGGGEDEDGNIHNMWRGVDQDGNECNLLLTAFKHIPYLRLTISFEFIDIYYMLTQND